MNALRHHCRLCGTALQPAGALALGDLPPCNRFDEGVDAPRLPLAMVECTQCQLVQLLETPPLAFVVPRHAWIRYNEPMAHLPDLARQLRAVLPQLLPQQPSTLAVGPFDAPLFQQMAEWGGAARELAALQATAPGRYPYLESLAYRLNGNVLAGVEKADLVSCRYLLEHCHDPVAALRAMAGLLTPDGVLLVEVPDSSKFLAACDYSFPWEEHICYFTEATLRALAAQAGLTVRLWQRYPGVLEDAMVLVLAQGEQTPQLSNTAPLGPSTLFSTYRDSWAAQSAHYRQWLQGVRAQGRRVAIFGAGHQAIMFIHALGLADLVDAVLDDAADKAGCRIPGTSIPIVPSAVLLDGNSFGLCLLALSAGAQQQVRLRYQAWLNQGGVMQTIFPGQVNQPCN